MLIGNDEFASYRSVGNGYSGSRVTDCHEGTAGIESTREISPRMFNDVQNETGITHNFANDMST